MRSLLLSTPATSRLPRLWVVGALLLVQALFGVNYSVTKVVVGAIPPLAWASIRSLAAAGLLFVIAIALRRPAPRLDREFLASSARLAFLGAALNIGCFLTGLRLTTSTDAAILNTLIPVFALAFVAARRIERVSVRTVGAFLLAFSGALLLGGAEKFSLSSDRALGDFLVVLNCASYAVFLSIAKPFMERHDATWATAWLFAWGGLMLSVAAIPEWLSWEAPRFTGQLLACMAFALLGATVLAYWLNHWALARAEVSHVALLIYVQPLIATALGVLWLGETVRPREIVAGALVLSGVTLALKRRGAPPAERDSIRKVA